ncbi:MAG: hypothetical protein JO079_11485 [Frankiaceae bacterium]|nr:hypothetical protein [Frankiaceae bacterium]
MRRGATTAALGIAVSCLAIGVGPSAQADPYGRTTTGGCSLTATASPLSPTTYSGTIGDASATNNSGGGFGIAGVTCFVEVNGVAVESTKHTYVGTPTQSGSDPVTFTANAVTDTVSLCRDVTYSDDGAEPEICSVGTPSAGVLAITATS